MEIKSNNRNLHAAKSSKKDEFYTQLPDIERELQHYRDHFRDKIIYCNCDDPKISGFFHYFSHNFEKLKLQKLITTCYKNQNIDLFSQHISERAVFLEYFGDKNQNKTPDLSEIKVNFLNGDGDFRSRECIELLKQADIVVTNPPFSLFRDFVSLMEKYDKKFLIIGSVNSITYKDIFKLIKDNKLWLGYGFKGGNAFFKTPHENKFANGVFDADSGLVKFRNVTWFTNLDIAKRHEDLILYKTYNPTEYPTYDNYEAIEVSKIKDIPMDYKGLMGVPITFLDKYNPDQFEIICSDYEIKEGKFPQIINTDWTGKVDRAYLDGKRMYARLIIKNKRPIL
jgi:hypothetical protein